MYLKKTPTKSGRISLSIVKGFRDGQGRVRQKTIQTLGFVDELEKSFDDPIAHFTSVVQKMTEKDKERTAPVNIEINPGKRIDMRTVSRKNVGCAALLSVYNALGIEKVLRNHSSKLKMKYDLNAVMRLLVIERLLHPCSKLSATENKDSYFFKSDFTLDDVYRSLDVLTSARDKIIGAMNRSIESLYGRDTRHVFYDVTNYYFECEPDSFRKKGVSKEHRPNPIVQMGLLQDANAIPLTYRLFPGNTTDSQTMIPVLADMKRDLNLTSITAVADRGLNSSANMAALVAAGDGFVFSQSIRHTKSDRALREKVLSEKGYQYNQDHTFKKKSWLGQKIIHLKAQECASGKAQDVSIPVRYVAFWSENYAHRAAYERSKSIKRAKELVENPALYTRASHLGVAKYVSSIDFNKDTGEVIDTDKIRILNEEAIAKDAQCDGYYLIVTSRTDWTDEEIIDAYRGLWQIEESFKITKSDIEARPVYVRTPAHIEAHFLTCYVALSILRLLQRKASISLSASQITSELSCLSCSLLEGNWWLFDYRSKITEELFRSVGLEHPKKYLQTASIKKLMQKH